MTEEATEQLKKLLYTVKLSNGDELLCTLIDVDLEKMSIVIDSPLLIRTIPVLSAEGIENTITSQNWMPFSLDRSFVISTKDVLTMGRMHPKSFTMYLSHLQSLSKSETATSPGKDSFFIEPSSGLQ
jgi:hypothetical protein